NTLSLSQFVGLAIHPTDASRSYGGTQDNGNQKRLTGGVWREFFSGDGGRTVLNPLNPSTVFITFVYGGIYRFDNNGDSFIATVGSNSTFGESDAAPRIAFFPPFTGNGVNSNLYFGTWRLFVSTDLGANWTAPGGTFDQTKGGSDVLSALAVARGNTNVIYSGSRQGRAMISNDGGASWTNISTGIPNRSITSLTVHPTDAAMAFLTVSGYGTGHIFKTLNGGVNWTDISGNLPDIPVNALLIDPLNSATLYAGTDIGVFRSDTGGGTWAGFNSGMPPVIVTALAAHPSGLIQAATFGRGVYELAGPTCNYSLSPTSQNFAAAGGAGTINLTTTSNCNWSATSNAAWISIANSHGVGSGAINFSVEANANSNQRTGAITIGDQTFNITQSGGTACNLSLPIAVGQTLSGQLSAGDCVRAGGSLADRFTFTGATGQQIAVNVNSTAFNAYALLTDAGNAVLAEDDNGGGGTNARIPAGNGFFTLPATGSYTILASAAAGQTGSYSISLTTPSSGSGLQFYPLAHPVRLLETRAGFTGCFAPGAPIAGGTSRTQLARGVCDGLTIPANAQAITGNITTVNSGGGFLTLYPGIQEGGAAQPLAANSNYGPNEVVNNVFTVGLGTTGPDAGAFKIFALNTTDVVVDVTGYYAPPASGGLYFHPLPKPIRLLETRAGLSGCFASGAAIAGGADTAQQARLTCDGVTIPAAALAIVGNATTVGPQTGGFLTLFPADAARPLAASSNYSANQIVNAPFTVGLSASGQFKIYSFATTGLVIDVLGYFSAEASDVNGARLLFNALSKPVRLLETRAGLTGCFAPGAAINGDSVFNQQARGQCNGETIPPAALAVTGNVTVVNSNGGFLTLWPSNATQPTVATSNFNVGQVFNRHFTVGLGTTGTDAGAFKLYSRFTTDVVIDLSGYFAP
ncbi:MAG TPA: BACON domain-containing carbohydrate-binding protein, partial [Blastocatellia bacterium]|nr:BACON domain-containing carbohydrate-binding protein [Blastocatellia bacterium]